jgi:hypothetical protein
MTPLAWAKLAAIAALIAGTWWHGRSTGADTVQARWDADTVARERAQQAQEAAQRRRAHDASSSYQAQAGKRAKAQESLRADMQTALNTPACPEEAPHALVLADLPIPGPALDRLRTAGADAPD